MSLLFIAMMMQSPVSTQVSMTANPYEYPRFRAMRDVSPEHYKVWWESRGLVGVPESDDPDAVTA